MTKERREDLVVLAVVASAAIHAGLMFCVSGRVLSEGGVPTLPGARAPMTVTRGEVAELPASIEELMDLEPIREEPKETGGLTVKSALSVASPEGIASEVDRMVESVPLATLRSEVEPPTVKPAEVKADSALTRVDGLPGGGEVEVLVSPLGTLPVRMPTPAVATVSAPVAVSERELPAVEVKTEAKPQTFVRPQAKVDFQPVDAVYERVDEGTIAKAKAAVDALVEAENPMQLEKFVNVTMTKFTTGGWTYFKVLMTPRSSLPPVPKDMVVLIDGSGSIGDDRLVSCRLAAKRILRSAMNTGDRFNLVVFRRNYEYAFRNWQPCTADSFAAADKWLAKLTAHGRTDVFSTISSVLTLPRSPERPLIALMVTDGDANEGVRDNHALIENFTILNGGLISVYMYGVKSSANRELLDRLTRSNRGENFVFEGRRWKAGEGIESLSERFRDPVVSDLKVIFAATAQAETYPRFLKNLYLGDTVELLGRVPEQVRQTAFAVRGIARTKAYEGYFKLHFARLADEVDLPAAFAAAAEKP